MIVSFSDPGFIAAICFGVFGHILLWFFASLIYEVDLAMQRVYQLKDLEAHAILWTTANLNLFGVMVAFVGIGYFCIQIGKAEIDPQQPFMLAIAASLAYVTYARSCENRLKQFLIRVEQVARSAVKE